MEKDDWTMVMGLIALFTMIALPVALALSFFGMIEGGWVIYVLGLPLFVAAIIHSEVCPERYYPIDMGGDRIG